MSDLIDLIRAKLEAAAGLNPAVDAVLWEVRMEYAGDTVYIRRPKSKPASADTRALARQFQVTRRTAQRWVKAKS